MAQYQWLTFTTINTKISEHERAENESRVRAHVARVGHARRKIRVANVHRDNHIEESDKRVKYKLQSLEFRSSETPSPRVIVDNARKEPFQVWSIDLLDNEHELLDTYINVRMNFRDPFLTKLVGLSTAVLRKASQLDCFQLVPRCRLPTSDPKSSGFSLRRVRNCCSSQSSLPERFRNDSAGCSVFGTAPRTL